MNLKTLTTLAAAAIASSAWAAGGAEQKCGAGTCGKKEITCKPGDQCDPKSDSGKDASCSKKQEKEASCSKK